MGKKDENRKELVKLIIGQSNGRIFSVTAKRKAPKVSYLRTVVTQVPGERDPQECTEKLTPAEYNRLPQEERTLYTKKVENFMELQGRTGVTKDLKGGKSTIAHKDDLVSLNLTNGKGYRCFSAYNVLKIKSGGAVIEFNEEDVLNFQGE